MCPGCPSAGLSLRTVGRPASFSRYFNANAYPEAQLGAAARSSRRSAKTVPSQANRRVAGPG
jgi:hypothetical protein